ncbi:aminodeoxychorismate synthase component I [Gordonia terrae]|uniref:aminodeoxychorismate synthase component I n=1 Tax=Gordonia terrae TaxID=2055 RepID=UPI003F6BAF0E
MTSPPGRDTFRIGAEDVSATELLRSLHRAASERGIPAPAALIGDWLDHTAVIAPSILIQEGIGVDHDVDAFWFGYVPFPDESTDAEVFAMVGGTADSVLCRDRAGCWWWTSTCGAPCPEWVMQAFRPVPHKSWRADWTVPSSDPHLSAIDLCLEAIRCGEVYQACVCTAFEGRLVGSGVDYFADVVSALGSRKAAYMETGDHGGAVLSFSPETFLSRRGPVVRSSPIKGTLPLSRDPADLRASDKDVAENIMIVDLVRNDLGRVAEVGTVSAVELLRVVPAPGVWHLASTIEAEVAPIVDDRTLVTAAFPPASVTGTPKLRARALIAKWESRPRGVYCGSIGVRSPAVGLDMNVAIRTVTVDAAGQTVLGVGGGITIDSDPAAEWQECLDKAASIVAFDVSGVRADSPRAPMYASRE